MKGKIKELMDWVLFEMDRKTFRFLILIVVLIVICLFVQWRAVFAILFLLIYWFISYHDHPTKEREEGEEEGIQEETDDVQEKEEEMNDMDVEKLEFKLNRLKREIRVTEKHISENPKDLEAKFLLEELKEEEEEIEKKLSQF